MLAGFLVVPMLVGIANLVGILAGMYAAKLTIGLGYESFLYGARLFWHSWDMFYSLAKATVFGFSIPLIAVHMGFRTKGGAEGVGKTTTQAVMFMTLTILILDALFPPLFLN
jgi:phospholipid/cholesterol/gamma-HCH transport system permease protein